MSLNWNNITNQMKQIWSFRIIFFSSAFACLGVMMTLWEIACLFVQIDKRECGTTISIIVGLAILNCSKVSMLDCYPRKK